MATHDFGMRPVPAHQHPNGGGWVANTAHVDDTAYVGPKAQVYGKARVGGEARVCQPDDLVLIGPLGSRVAMLTAHRRQDYVATGCFHGTLAELRAKVAARHRGNQWAQQYERACVYIEAERAAEKSE